MLQFIRSHASSVVIRVLFLALVAAFVLWGIGDVLHQAPPPATVATIGDTKISINDYQQEYRRQLQRLSSVLGGQYTDDLAKQMGLPKQVLDGMVGNALYHSLAAKLGMRAPDDVLRQMLQTTPAFLNEAGQFDPQRFAAVLYQSGLSEAAFVTHLGPDFLARQIQEAIGRGASAPAALVADIYQYRNEKRIADTLLIADATIKDIPVPDSAALTKFHQDHADRYQAPEYRRFTMVRIRIPEDQIAKEFAAHPDKYDAPAKRHLLTFMVPDEAAAKKALTDIIAGHDFAAVAKQASGTDPADTGPVDKSQLLEGMAEPAFAAKEGDIVGPVKTPLGWQIAKVVKIDAAQPRTLAEVHDEIARQLSEIDVTSLQDTLNQLQDALASGTSLEDAARKLGLPIEAFQATTKDGMDTSNKPNGELIGTPNLLNTVFGTDAGQVSDAVDDGVGGFYVVRTDAVTPAALRPFDQVKDKVLADWQQEARDKAAADQANKIVERIKLGEDLKTIAQSLGVAVTRTSAFTRDAGDPANGVSPALASLLFAVKKGQAATAPTDTGANPGHVVAAVVDIQTANPASDADGTKKLTDELTRSMAQDLVTEFRAALQNEIPVTIDTKAAEGAN